MGASLAADKQAQKVVRDLMTACDSLMAEVTQQKATNWGVVNSAMVAGARFLSPAKAPDHA